MVNRTIAGGMLVLLLGLVANADESGQPDLDSALELKVTAENFTDLDKVIKLAETAIEKGLSDDQEAFAKKLIASTLYESANRITQPILEASPPNPRWPLLRNLAIPKLEKLFTYDDEMADAHLMYARLQALPKGNRAKGLASADKAVKLAGDDKANLSDALLVRASLSPNDEGKKADINQAIKINPKNLKAYQVRGLLNLADQKYEDALKDLEKAVELEPTNARLHLAVAETLTVLEKYDDAKGYADKAIELEPNNATAYTVRARLHVLQEDLDEAISDLNKAVKAEPKQLAPLLMRSRLHIEKEDYKKAEADVNRALVIQPGLVQAILLRATLRAERDDWDGAITDLEKAMETDPGNVSWRLQLAAFESAAGRPRKAIKLYSDLVAEDDSNWIARRGRADALLSVGKQKEAIEDYEQILKIEPNHSGVLNNLAWVLATSPKDDIRNAKRSIELGKKACELTEYKMPHILSTLAAGYAESGDFKTAIKWSSKAVESAEDDVADQLKEELESYKKGKPWREMQETEEKPKETQPDPSAFEI
ncbi:MAG: tetratricopeptide repeat protein [bacterium]|nr:tetratricopeptide repeat protein [bacterium]